ncbi:hypothetical protein [Chryseobacterium culicis]|uniref:hypothetical protein n=1 Tax=Chryseobacterium culicis TaxID=680127 RepID=UPI00258E371D|nr:hypothetical protein [Chryseobacterium culicis]
MDIKTLFWAGTLFLSAQAYSQIGITTPSPSSTLDIRGSVEGNYREITGANNFLAADDYHVSFSGTGSSNLTLPAKSTTDNTVTDFRGRKYYIKNNSTSSDLTLNAAGGQILRIGGITPNSASFVLKPGKSAILTAGNTNGWDIDVDVNGQILDLQAVLTNASAVSTQDLPAPGTYGELAFSPVTVTVPSSNTKVLLSFNGFMVVFSSSGTYGKVRFRIAQKIGSTTTYYNDVDLLNWVVMNGVSGLTRYEPDYAILYTVPNLAPGTYRFSLEAVREDEAGNVNKVTHVVVCPRAEVYLK